MPTSPARNKPCDSEVRDGAGSASRDKHAGFTLLEMALTLLIIGLIAALGLPFSRPGGGAAALRIKAMEIVAVLRSDRNLALRSGQTVTVRFDDQTLVLTSTGTMERIDIPAPMTVQIFPAGSSGFQFYANGRSSGGRLLLSSKKLSYSIDVNRLTSAVDLTGA